MGAIEGVPIFYSQDCDRPQAVGMWPHYRIVVGPSWATLPEDQQIAVLHHELGHCKGFHREWRLAMVVVAAIPVLAGIPWHYVAMALLSALLWEGAQFVARWQETRADRFAFDRGHGRAMLAYLSSREARWSASITKIVESADVYPAVEERAARLEHLLKGTEKC